MDVRSAEKTHTVALELPLVLVALVTRFRLLDLLQKMIVTMVSRNVINGKSCTPVNNCYIRKTKVEILDHNVKGENVACFNNAPLNIEMVPSFMEPK